MAAETGRDEQPVGNRPEDGLMIGRDVVDAGDELRIRDVRELREQCLGRVADRRAPELAAGFGVAARTKVAGEHAAVGELLRGEAALGGDDERLEQPLPDRLAEEQMTILAPDRQVDTEGREQRGRVDTGGDDEGLGRERPGDPAAAVAAQTGHLRLMDVDSPRKGLDDRLRPVEVAVLGAPGRARERGGLEAWDERGRLVGTHDA